MDFRTFLNMNNEETQAALSILSDIEAEIIRLRFGIGDSKPRTLQEVARKFSITRKKVRQIESVALIKICHQGRN